MDRRWPRSLILSGVVLAMFTGGGCHDDNNTVTGPLPAPTSTPLPGGPTSTPQPGVPTRTPTVAVATPTPLPSAAIVNVGQGGGMTFADQRSGGSTTTIAVGTTVQWVWVSGFHSTTSGTCGATCTPDGNWDSGAGSGMTFSKTFNQAGTFPYFCTVHGALMTGSVVVQ